MMEGKAGVNMEFRKKMSRAKSNSPMKRSFRRAVAWLLVFCMCMANMNSAVYAAEIATSSDALMAATPSDATATDSNASEILMPEETISGEELKEEAIRVISAGYEFDFDSEIRLMKDAEGKNESYSDLFKGYRSFTLFGDNGNGGRLTGGSDKAYGYIIVRVEKEAYDAFEKEEGTVKATDSDATGSDAAERSYTLTGNEELVFLYVNADDGSVTFTLNIENLNADDIVVPSHTELYAETEEETEEAGPAEQPAEDANEAGSPDAGGGSGSGSGDSSSDSEDDPTDEGASEDGQTEGGQTEGGNGGSADADTDTEAPAEKPEDGQTGGGSDSQQENNGSSDTDTENGNDGNTGNSEDNGSNSDSGNDNHGNADSGNTGNTENSGNSGSGSGSESGKDEGGSSDKGDSSDKGGSDSGRGSSNSGNSGNSGSGSSSDQGGSDSDSAKLSKSSLNLPMVMGPNPNAEFEEDEFGDMSFDEWQEMMEEEEEEAEDEEDYTEEVSVAYDSEDDGISYLNMTMLPAVGATVKKAQPKRAFKLFKSSRSDEAEAVVMAGVVPLSGMIPEAGTYYKQIEQNDDGSYRLHLGVTGGERQGLDIVLAIDLSNSMDEPIGDEHNKISRLNALKNTLGYGKMVDGGYHKPDYYEDKATGFIDDLFEQSPNSRFSVVTYSTDSSRKLGWTELGSDGSGKKTIKTTIGELKVKGGTNYEAGLYETIEILRERGTSNNIPVVIFLSDGKPTYYYTPAGEFNGYDSSWTGNNRGGSGDSITTETGDGTILAAGKFHDEIEKMNGSVYTVGFGIPGLDKNDYKQYQPEQYLYAISQGLTWEQEGEWWQDKKWIAPDKNDGTTLETNGANAQELNEAFKKILANLKMTNVTISDQLSKFVTFTGETAGASNVKVQTFTKNEETGELSLKETLEEGKDYASLELNSETGTINLIFGENTKLENGVIYEVSFDIKVKDGVEIQPADKVQGDPNTDYKDGNISSGKLGIKTNTDAYFSFGEDGTTKVYYPHPVIPASATYKPEHQKYIKDNGDGTYDLTLTVKSDKGSEIVGEKDPVPADIMFVVDKSGSMDQKIGPNGNRKEKKAIVNDALETMISQLSESGSDIAYAGYKFSDSKEPVDFGDKSNPKYWETNTENALSKLKLDTVSGGTYPSSSLSEAVLNLNTGSQEGQTRNKYFIFLCDGMPGNGYWLDGDEASKSYTAVKNLTTESSFYSICVADKDAYSFMEEMKNSASSNNSQLYYGTDEAGIKAAFQQIADDIAGQIGTQITGVTNAVITDQLSAYADMVEDSEIVVTRNEEVLREGSDYTKTYEADTKTVKVNLTGELVQNAVYKVTFKVKPSQAAKEAYQQDKGYHHGPNGEYIDGGYVGDDNTDAPDNTTSSGQPGFPSNKQATLSYEYDGSKGSLTYAHPVLQVPQTGQFVVQKIVTIDDNPTPLADAKFIINLEKTEVDGSQGQKFSSVALKNTETSPVVKTEGEAHFKISEAVPMEYSLKGIKVFQKTADAGQQDITAERLANSILTVKPGDDLIVQLTNNLAHEGYFHSVDQVTNRTTGNPAEPFTNDKSAAREAAESQPTADTGKRNKKVAEMEEEEGDPLV